MTHENSFYGSYVSRAPDRLHCPTWRGEGETHRCCDGYNVAGAIAGSSPRTVLVVLNGRSTRSAAFLSTEARS